MNKENKPVKNLNTPEELKKRNRKAILKTFVVLTLILSAVMFVRAFVLNRGNTFGSVNGVSTEQEQGFLTKINFIDSGTSKSSKVFGDMTSPFTSDSPEKFWLQFNIGEKTTVGYLDTELKFNKVYDLPSTVKLVKLLSDGSIFFTDEPSKQQPALYYQVPGGEVIRFSSLDYQDTYLSIYFDPSEKLVYYLGKDNTNTFFLYSVNEKGVESSIFKTGDLTEKARIISIDPTSTYLQDGDICYGLSFANKKMSQIDCSLVKRNDSNKAYTVFPKILPSYTEAKPGELLEVNSLDGVKKSLGIMPDGQTISKLSFSQNTIVFTKASLNPIAEATFLPKDVSVMMLNLETGQATEVTNRLPSDNISNYFGFTDKLIALGGAQNSKLLLWVPTGSIGQVYVGDVAPVSYTTVTKYWTDIDLGGAATNIKVLNGDFLL
ncbi:MAG: hypothetical protein ACMG57_02885 [Candidatus Dojkabacteria bacterium]